jgi:hypothetical protein
VAERDVLQSHLEALVCEVLEADRVAVDDRGEVPLSCAGTTLRVRLRPHHRGHVEVYGYAVEDVPLDPGLLEELNTLNRRGCRARTFWTEELVVVAAETHALRANAEELDELLDEVAGRIRAEGPRLAEKYGGRVPKDSEESA